MILLFFFTYVYVWHDQNVKQMNNMYVEKMNAGMQLTSSGSGQSIALTVTATGSNVELSRLWIDSDSNHVYVSLESAQIHVAPGAGNVTIQFGGGNAASDGYGGWNATCTYDQLSKTITVDYTLPTDSTLTFTVVNTLGIAAST